MNYLVQFGYLTELDFKKKNDSSEQLLTPKLLVRYSPGSMRQESSGTRLDP